MSLSLRKGFVFSALILLSIYSSAKKHVVSGSMPFLKISLFKDGGGKDDSVYVPARKIGKICSCQVLELQSTNHHHRNFAVLAEKTNGRSVFSDIVKVNRILEKEKKHIQFLFYDKLSVVNSVTEATDCRSLYSKLKFKNRSLMLYDILDADVRR
ncbi:MAG: hypothetical protein JST87_18150 [Bacteroidetes bacterium]|nr:hypothetical protein [Bacteroidota bacterium]